MHIATFSMYGIASDTVLVGGCLSAIIAPCSHHVHTCIYHSLSTDFYRLKLGILWFIIVFILSFYYPGHIATSYLREFFLITLYYGKLSVRHIHTMFTWIFHSLSIDYYMLNLGILWFHFIIVLLWAYRRKVY